MKKEQAAEIVARHLAEQIEKHGAPAWKQSDPIRIWEVFSDGEKIELAATHDTEAALMAAALAPRYGKGQPVALLVETSGSVWLSQHAYDTGDLDSENAATPEVPTRTARITLVTVGTVWDTLSIETGAGEQIAGGQNDNYENAAELLALLTARMVDKAGQKEAITKQREFMERAGLDMEDITRMMMNGEAPPPELREIIEETMKAAGIDTDALTEQLERMKRAQDESGNQ